MFGRIITYSGRMTVVLDSTTAYTEFSKTNPSSITINLDFGGTGNTVVLNPALFEEISVSMRPGDVVEATIAFAGSDISMV